MATKIFTKRSISISFLLGGFLLALIVVSEPDFLFKAKNPEVSYNQPGSIPADVNLALHQALDGIKNINENASRRASVGLILALLGIVIAWMAEYYLGEDKQEKALLDFGEQLKALSWGLAGAVSWRNLGTGEPALISVLHRAAKAKHVRNTFIVFGVPEHEVCETSYKGDQLSSIKECVTNVLNRGAAWTDIVSQEIVTSAALSWLSFLPGVEPEKRDGYEIYRLKEIYPVINFMLLEYDNNVAEAIFGWGHHPEDHGAHIFLTEDKHVVAMFDAFWHALKNDSVPFRSDVPRPIASADIVGLWFSTGYDKPDWDPYQGIPPGDSPSNVALFEISLDDNRNITIRGKILEDKARPRPLKSVSADLEESRLWFSTEVGSLFDAGWYQFIQPLTANPSNGHIVEEFYGQFVYPEKTDNKLEGQPQHYVVKDLAIFGKRVTKDWPNLPTKLENSRFLPSDPKLERVIFDRCQDWWRDHASERWVGPSKKSNTPIAKAGSI